MTRSLRINTFFCTLVLAGCLSSTSPQPASPPLQESPVGDDASLVAQQTKLLITKLEDTGALYSDSSFTRIADAIISKLGVERNGSTPRILLLRNPSINAVALYDGAICVYSGLVARLTHPSQLAFVLAHEAIHWQREHTLLQFQSATNTLLAAQLADTFISPIAARFQLRAVAESGIDLASTAATNTYSRSLEDEADRLGASMMASAGYDPQGAFDVIRIFEGTEPTEITAGDELFRAHAGNYSRSTSIREHLGLAVNQEQDKPLLHDRAFILGTAAIRIENASWTARSGAFFDALENLEILLDAYEGQKRDVMWHRAQLLQGEIYQAMARDLRFVKLSLSPLAWQERYAESSDSAIAESWCSQARQAFRNASNHRAIRAAAHEQLRTGRCSTELEKS